MSLQNTGMGSLQQLFSGQSSGRILLKTGEALRLRVISVQASFGAFRRSSLDELINNRSRAPPVNDNNIATPQQMTRSAAEAL